IPPRAKGSYTVTLVEGNSTTLPSGFHSHPREQSSVREIINKKYIVILYKHYLIKTIFRSN
ncbi:MAG: hypothetical protein RRA45_09035, partial [Saccharolobus sp.]|uniref:hypothetical protein n=1 Tax=Saccharolobus sp. TaxID=2100761 RepID=UPI0028CDEC80